MPKVLACFVTQALAQTEGSVVVSMELTAETSPAWAVEWAHPSDGRTSQAMADLITWLRTLRGKTGRVTIDYQLGCRFDGVPADPDAFGNRCIGESIKASMTKGFVIAYGGNSHAARLETPTKRAAAFLPDSIKTVEIMVSNGGSAWGTYNNSAPGPSPILGRQDLSGMNGIIPGQDPGFEYAYVIKNITASYPAYTPPSVAQSKTASKPVRKKTSSLGA
ncbi:hypothetical protein [Asticcacaulis sp. MM231]|uniref:hypothetical protein n=1 Tax=Asticcacaulis sp. MM231 TaxID=3157666 RepID=UPI0032D59968